MTASTRKLDSPYLHSFLVDLSTQPVRRWINETLDIAIRMLFVALVTAALVVSFSSRAKSQSQLISADTSSAVDSYLPPLSVDPLYTPPTAETKMNNYLFDAFGPYPMASAAISAGYDQLDNTTPEWGQGFAGYGKRFGSNFGVLAVGTTAHFALSAAFKEDSLYYRCECRGAYPRFRHAILATFMARRGSDGHSVFSVPALIAPYAGSMTAVYGWYPNGYGVTDGLKIGSYSLLGYMGGNVLLEFLYSGPHSLRTRMHLNNTHGSPLQGPNQ
jgi:hypothetical protein